MKGKKLLAGLLVGVMIVCFVPVVGYGLETEEFLTFKDRITLLMELKVNAIQLCFLDCKIRYIMYNPTSFLYIDFIYIQDSMEEQYTKKFPPDTCPNLKNKVFIEICDTRDIFSNKSGLALLEQFKKSLEVIYSFLEILDIGLDTNFVAKFYSEYGIPLGYFYQGEYHLWKE